jgi:hypothetical protein
MYAVIITGANHLSCSLSAYIMEAKDDSKARVTKSPKEAERNQVFKIY